MTIEPGRLKQVDISEKVRLTNVYGWSIENKTIHVTTSDEISLYGVNRAKRR